MITYVVLKVSKKRLAIIANLYLLFQYCRPNVVELDYILEELARWKTLSRGRDLLAYSTAHY